MHAHLRSVCLSGFQAVLGLGEVALYILGNATALGRMVVDPVVRMKHERRGFYSARYASGSRSATKRTRPWRGGVRRKTPWRGGVPSHCHHLINPFQ